MSETIGKYMNARSSRPNQQNQSTILLDEKNTKQSKNKSNGSEGGYTILIILCVCIVIITLLIAVFTYKVNQKVQLMLNMPMSPMPAPLMPVIPRYGGGVVRNPNIPKQHKKTKQVNKNETQVDQPQNPDMEHEMPEENPDTNQKEVSIDIVSSPL